ncbi:unnamed protein product [Lampetra fluviatilis]
MPLRVGAQVGGGGGGGGVKTRLRVIRVREMRRAHRIKRSFGKRSQTTFAADKIKGSPVTETRACGLQFGKNLKLPI